MARVFLSHSSLDNASADRMKDWLDKQDFQAPFLDFDKDNGIQPGADWEKTLYREIERSQALLILLSTNWSASKWCDREFTCARFLGKPIFQVVDSENLWPCPSDDGYPGNIPAPNLHFLDLRQDREAGFEQLRKKLKDIALSEPGGFSWDKTRAPYPGLLAFEEEDAPIYFGRDDEIRHLIERLSARRTLGGARLLVLLGASGSGKSSLLRAGVLPRLRRSGREWLVVPPFRPQSEPCQELARALALAAGRGTDWRDWYEKLQKGDSSKDSDELPRVLKEIAGDLRMAAKRNEAQILLTIDQGEELFGGLEQQEAKRFFRILTAAMAADLPFMAVMTLRSEFLGRLQAAEKDGLTARFEEVSLAPMPMARIPEIITGPAKVAGLKVEEKFVQEAARHAETEDALPLLAVALSDLYERFGRDGGVLTKEKYLSMGNGKDGDKDYLSPLENSVRRRADEVLAEMQPTEEVKKALRDAFVSEMVHLEQDNSNYVRLPARWEKLPEEAKPLLEQLINARLLISRDEEGYRMVEVAHEALLRKWPLLRGWLDENREFIIGKGQLHQDLLDWQKAPASEKNTALLTGLKLQRAKAWLAERRQLSDDLRGFVQASSDLAETQQLKERRNRQRVIGGLSGLSALALAGAGIAWWREGAARAAQVEQYAANHRSLLTSNPLESVVNGLAAVNALRSNPVAAIQLSDTLDQAVLNNLERDSIPTGQGQVSSLVALPNDELASGGSDGSIKRWSQDGNQIGRTIITGQGQVLLLLGLPKGELVSAGRVASVYSDTTIKRWGKDGNQIGPSISTGQGQVSSLVALPNGELASGGSDGTVKRWGKDGKQIGRAIYTTRVTSLVALPDGELASGSDGSIKRWGKDGNQIGKTIITGQREVSSLVALPNGELASAGPHNNSKGNNTITTIKRWGKDGKQIGQPISTDQVQVTSLVALPNGELASAGRNMNNYSNTSIKRWGKDGNQIGRPITTGQVNVSSLVALPNGLLASGGIDGNVKRWGKEGEPVTTIKTGKERITSLVALPNGELAIGGDQGSFTVWGKDGEPPATIKTDKGEVTSLVALPNDELAIGGVKGLMRWRKDGKPIAKSPATQEEVYSLAALPNGELVSGGLYGKVKRWGKDGNQIGKSITTPQGRVISLVALADGKLASLGDETQNVEGFMLWDKDGTSIPTDGQNRAAYSLLALPNGELLSGWDEGLMRWSKDGKFMAYISTAQGAVYSLAALPKDTLVSGGVGSVKFWDKDGKPMGTITTGKGRVTSLVALPKGELVAIEVSGEVRTVRRWSLEAVAKRACLDLRNHPALLKPQTPPQWAAKENCGRLDLLNKK
jgi:WD40 repeat protein